MKQPRRRCHAGARADAVQSDIANRTDKHIANRTDADRKERTQK